MNERERTDALKRMCNCSWNVQISSTYDLCKKHSYWVLQQTIFQHDASSGSRGKEKR